MKRKAPINETIAAVLAIEDLLRIVIAAVGALDQRISGTCRAFRLVAARLADQRTVERIVSLMPTEDWVAFCTGGGVPPGPDKATSLTARVRSAVHAQSLRWELACPFRFHDLGDITRAGRKLSVKANELLSAVPVQPKAKAVESVSKLRELLLDPEEPSNIAEYGRAEVYDIHELRTLSFLSLERDTDVTFWDTSRVTDMASMAEKLNARLKGIGHWNTARVTSMRGTFAHSAFNEDIGSWDVGRVRDMTSMFADSRFDRDIGRWDTSSVRDMSYMFSGAEAFNQDIGTWDVGRVDTMGYMFLGAKAFDRDISAWAVGGVRQAFEMFSGCPITEAHMPHIGLAVAGPRATELRPEITRIMAELGLSKMSVVCVDSVSDPIRVSLNKSAVDALARAGSEMRTTVQDRVLRYVCSKRGQTGVEFNWTPPLNKPYPWACPKAQSATSRCVLS